jgi:hypothetical protein
MLFADRGSLFISVDKFRQNLTWRIPMKIASILAGVAVAALTASAASAGDINQGQTQVPFFGTANVGGGFLGGLNNANAQWGGSPISSWHAVGESEGNNGTAATSDGATFTLKGAVSTDCAYYSGTGNQVLDFGTIGIYASDNTGPAAAFTMTDDASVEINTNLAGCNTVNTVTVSKVNMVSDNTGGYDAAIFRNDLPFSVTAAYKAGATNSTTASNQSWTVGTGQSSDFRKHGAWKSAMSLNVNIPQQQKALLAGNYTGSVSVTIAAGI